jgi:hypothetical protein
MTEHLRRGEKMGWLEGWSGMFLWVMIISIVRLLQGFVIDASIGICLFIAGMISGFVFVPWRYPTIRYWKLMIPGYLAFFFSIFWTVWTFGGFGHPDLRWWIFVPILSCLVPFIIVGRRCWEEKKG